MADEIDRLRAYWTAKRGSRLMPDRFDVEPVHLAGAGLITRTFIAELPTLALRVVPSELEPWLGARGGRLIEALGEGRSGVAAWAVDAPARGLPAIATLRGPLDTLVRLGLFPLRCEPHEARLIGVLEGLAPGTGDRPDVLSVAVDADRAPAPCLKLSTATGSPVVRLPPRLRVIQGGRA